MLTNLEVKLIEFVLSAWHRSLKVRDAAVFEATTDIAPSVSSCLLLDGVLNGDADALNHIVTVTHATI